MIVEKINDRVTLTFPNTELRDYLKKDEADWDNLIDECDEVLSENRAASGTFEISIAPNEDLSQWFIKGWKPNNGTK